MIVPETKWHSRVVSGPLGLFVAVCIAVVSCLLPATASAEQRKQPLRVGDQAPDFDLPIQGADAYLSLSDLAKEGPVVVIVLRGYPGYQCPICTSQLGSLINRASRLARAMGNQPHRVVLVYPGVESGLEQRAKRFVGSRRLPVPLVLVRDPNMEMISAWGLRWKDRRDRETAYPAAYLIGAGRRVKWAKVSDSHSGRATVEQILKAINNL